MPRYSTILTALFERLEAHKTVGGVLAGFKVTTNPKAEAEGKADLPTLRVIEAPDIKEQAHAQMTIVTGGTMTLKFGVATDINLGIPAHVEAVEKAMDAMELDGYDIDLLLDSTLAQPFSMTASDSFTQQNGISRNTFITLTLVPKAFKSGARRS